MALLALLFLSLAARGLSEEVDVKVCPSPCTCNYQDDRTDRFTVDCTVKGLKTLPDLSPLVNQTVFRIYLGYNNMEKLTSKSFVGLLVEGIDVTANPIKEISPDAFEGLESSLKYLSLRRTQLAAWPTGSIKRLENLQTLDISEVFMASSLPLQAETFLGLANLEELALSSNSLSDIDENAFKGLNSLNVLLLEENKLTAFPAACTKLPSLVELSLENNKITSLGVDSLKGLTQLKILKLGDNSLTQETLQREVFQHVSKSLETLNLDFNELKDISTDVFGPLKSLKKLHLAGTMLTKLNGSAFADLSSLQWLDLSDNDLNFTAGVSSEAFTGVEDTLEVLLLNRVQLTKIPVKQLKSLLKLNELYLSGNDIVSLEGINQLSVTFFDLEYCQISHIDKMAFDGISEPLSLKLSYNKLTNLTFITDICMFRKLELNGNKITCDCAVYNLFRASGPKVTGKCSSPDDVKGLTLQSVTYEEVMSGKCEEQASSKPATCHFATASVAKTRSVLFHTLAIFSLVFARSLWM